MISFPDLNARVDGVRFSRWAASQRTTSYSLNVSKSAFDFAWISAIEKTGNRHWYEPLPRSRRKRRGRFSRNALTVNCLKKEGTLSGQRSEAAVLSGVASHTAQGRPLALRI